MRIARSSRSVKVVEGWLESPFFEAVDSDELYVVTSMVTLIKVLVHPLRRNDVALAGKYRDILLNAGGLRTVPLSQEIAQEAAKLRATHDLRTPNAIELSTATSEGASFFLTNDSRLPSPPGVQMPVLDQLREQL